MLATQTLTSPSPMTPGNINVNELGTPTDALQAYCKLLSNSGQSVRLHCAMPTCCDPEDDEMFDLHDLHTMRTRCLVFLNELIATLRSSGVPASYKLVPSSSSCCLVCTVPSTEDAAKVKHDAIEAVSHARYSRHKMLLADLKSGPAIIIT